MLWKVLSNYLEQHTFIALLPGKGGYSSAAINTSIHVLLDVSQLLCCSEKRSKWTVSIMYLLGRILMSVNQLCWSFNHWWVLCTLSLLACLCSAVASFQVLWGVTHSSTVCVVCLRLYCNWKTFLTAVVLSTEVKCQAIQQLLTLTPKLAVLLNFFKNVFYSCSD